MKVILFFLILNLIFRPKGDDDDDEDDLGKDDDDDERGEGDGHAPHWPLDLLLGHPGRPTRWMGRITHCAVAHRHQVWQGEVQDRQDHTSFPRPSWPCEDNGS